MSTHSGPKKTVTVPWVMAQKNVHKISMLTAYDYPTAKCVDEAGVDLILVGDSLGTVLYGYPNTLAVTLEDTIRHTQAVTRAVERAMVIADLPFLSYQVSISEAIRSAGRCLKEAGAHAVKLEGGLEMAETIQALSRAGIPVQAHIGLTPQKLHAMGGYRMHGKSVDEQDLLKKSARAVQDAGAFSVVLECVQPELASEITRSLRIPTIGIGSGAGCDGQVLVIHDLLGLTSGHVPKFVHPTADLRTPMMAGLRAFVERTQKGEF